MKKPTPDEIEEVLRRSEAARRQMQEIIDRVEARMAERRAAHGRNFLRPLFAR
jgi:hypothetical protein